jgi:cytochrome c oxidase subunit 2
MKQDAVPGREIVQWFEATKPGKYELPCAELCGFGHSGMKGWIHVHGAEEYQKWAAENLTASPAAGDKKAEEPKKDAAVAATTGGQSKR